jgi:hypothetical protein
VDGWVRATALGLTVLTDFSGLVYEVAWQKYLATRRSAPPAAVATTASSVASPRARIERRIGPLSDASG